MSAGDTVRIHFHLGTAGHGWNVTVTDVTTGHCGTIVLNSKYGPLLPLYSTQQIGNALGWGLVDDTPNAFVWEIGHTSNFSTQPASLLSGADRLRFLQHHELARDHAVEDPFCHLRQRVRAQ